MHRPGAEFGGNEAGPWDEGSPPTPPKGAVHRSFAFLRTEWNRHRALAVLLGAALAAYVALALLQPSDLDEGGYLLSAVQIAHGQVPFVNFVGIEPVVPYYLSVGVLLFGPSLVVARLQMILLVLATASGLYAVGRSQHSPAAGLIAAGLFLFGPLSLYYNSIVILESASLLPLVLATAVLLRRRPDPALVPSLVIGVLLAVAFLTRRDTALLAPLFLVAAVIQSRSGQWFRAVVGIVVGFAALTLPVLGYFAARTSIPWVYAQYGFGAAYSKSLVALPFHLGALAYGILVLPALAIGLTGVGSWYLRARGFSLAASWTVLFGGIPTLLLLVYGLNYQNWGQGEALFAGVVVVLVVLLLAWVGFRYVLGLGLPAARTRAGVTVPFLLLWGAIILAFFTFVYPSFYIHYLIEVTAPASLVVGIYVADLVGHLETPAAAREVVPGQDPATARTSDRRPRSARSRALTGRTIRVVVLSLVLVVPSVAGAVLILGPTNPYNTPTANGLPSWNLYQRVYPLSEIDQVASYLDAHTSSNMSVFTADSIFAAAADRLVLLNLSTVIDDYIYPVTPLGMNQSPLGPNNFGLAPTLSEIFSKWNRTYIPYVIVGGRTAGWETVTPYLSRYLAERYHPVAVFDPGLSTEVVTVEGLGPSVNAPPVTGSFPSTTAPSAIVVDSGASLAFEGNEASSTIEAINSSGARTSVSLPNGDVGVAALALSPSGARLVAAVLPGSLLVYSVSPTGSTKFLDAVAAPGAVSELSFGGNSTVVYGLVPTQSSVIAVDLTTSSVLSLITTDPNPIAFAVGFSEKRIAVSTSASANVAMYNLASGKLLRHYGTGAVVSDHLAFVGNELVGTQASPAVAYWLNLTSGVRDPVVDLTGVAAGFSVTGNLLFTGDLESGSVTVVNVTNGDPAGTLATGVCPQTLGFDARSNVLWATGSCSPMGAVLAVSAPERFPLLAPVGVAVSVDGLPSPAPAAEALFPGVHEIGGSAGGATTLALVGVTAGGSHSVADPSPVDTWSTLQIAFSIAVGLGGLGAILGLVGLALWRPEMFLISSDPASGGPAVR